MENILLQFLIRINLINLVCSGGALWTFIQKRTCYYLIVLDWRDLNFLLKDNNETVIDELLYNFKECKVSLVNQKLRLCTMKFPTDSWEKLAHTKKEQLIDTYQNLFHLLTEFSKLKKTEERNILILEHPVQEITSSMCGLFQLYFYKNIFNPDERSKIINHETPNKKTIEQILNEIFSTDVNQNEHEIENFKKEYDL